jgi:tetratricopeptide (TPR) repeat protein
MSGYLVAVQAGPDASRALSPAAAQSAAAAGEHVVNEDELRAHQAALEAEPDNAALAARLGNLYYDAHRFEDAIPYYQRAWAIDSRNVSLSTDLGTALWYSGKPDEALAQYERSLSIAPAHPETMLNMGIVFLEGKRDAKRAIEVWQRLLASNPRYSDREKVERLLAKARG